MLCCHPGSQLSKVIGKWQSWNIKPGALTLRLVLFLPCLAVCCIHCFLFFFLFCLPLGWIFWSLFDNISLPWLYISQGSFHFKWQKTYWEKVYWFMYREEWGVSGDRQFRVWALTDIIRIFFSCFSCWLSLVFGLIHSLLMSPFCGGKYSGRQHLCVSPPRATQE